MKVLAPAVLRDPRPPYLAVPWPGLTGRLLRLAHATDFGRCSCPGRICGFQPPTSFKEWLRAL